MDLQEEKYRKMTQPPVQKVILKLAVPCIISMLVTAFYNMADTFFVGMLDDTSASGAVGVAFSMMAIIQAVGFFFGHGSGNFISRCLGQKNYENAAKMAATGFFSAFFAGILICIAGSVFLKPLAYLLGSTDTILPYTMAYMQVILLGAPWMCASLVLNNQLRFQGSAIYAMVGIFSGAVINIGLDPLLMFTFGLGVAGAGWATIISQFISFVILLIGCSRGGNLRISFKNMQFKGSYYLQMLKGGLPSLARQGLASVATICLNQAAKGYGDAAIAAMGIVQRIMHFGASAMIGFGQGFQPFCGFNYGAKLYRRVKDGFRFCVKGSFFFLLFVSTLLILIAEPLVGAFRNDPDVIAFGTLALRLQCMTFPLQSWIVMSNMMEQVMGRTVPATFLAMARQGVFFIPAVLGLTALFGPVGVQSAQSVADVLTIACAVPIQLYVMRSLPDHDLVASGKKV